MENDKLNLAFQKFDQYNSRDPNIEIVDDKSFPKELLYGERMTGQLLNYKPDASEALQLAARCQHIGRWEIPRKISAVAIETRNLSLRDRNENFE
jgi:hypothetical protein